MTKELTRKALYDLVWSKPMSTIAKDYGLSDRGMAKLCERNSIPVPPRGYWAKKAAGQKVTKSPLVVFHEKEPDTAILLRGAQPSATAPEMHEKEAPSLPESVQRAIAGESLPEHLIKVPATLHSPHRIVEGWIKTEKHEADLDKRFGRTSYRPAMTLLEQRKRRILSTLFKALEARGFKISEESVGNYYHKQLRISLESDTISIQMNERIRQYRRELTEKEKEDRYYSSTPKWTQVKEPMGKLEISLTLGEYSYSKIKVQEDDNKPFEEMLNEVMVKVIEKMWEAKSDRLRKEENERQRQKEARERRLCEEAAENEDQRKRNLEKKALSWQRAGIIRDYIAAVEEARKQGKLETDEAGFIAWRTWAIKHADSLDYITQGNPLISLSEAPENLGEECQMAVGYDGRSAPNWHPNQKWYHR